MKVQIDTKRLRAYLIDYYGTATLVGSPYAFGDVVAMDDASSEQLIQRAESEGIDLHKFVVPGSERQDSGDWGDQGYGDGSDYDDVSDYDWYMRY